MSLSSGLPAFPHILLIDDRPDDLRLLVEVLRRERFRLSVAFGGSQGYARAVASVPDLILLDVRMPKVDGFAVMRLLKANIATAHIPILFLTACTELAERLTGLREGGADYISKPFQAEEVIERVKIHLELARAGARAAAPVNESSAYPPSEHEVIVLAAKQYLQGQLVDPPKSGELARILGVPERRLTNAFIESLGLTVFEFIRNERMRAAQHLLAKTSLSIIAIAEEVGFSSAANFSTAFRDFVGKSPSSFRSKMPNRPASAPVTVRAYAALVPTKKNAVAGARKYSQLYQATPPDLF